MSGTEVEAAAFPAPGACRKRVGRGSRADSADALAAACAAIHDGRRAASVEAPAARMPARGKPRRSHALEEVRVEAVGRGHMAGVAANLPRPRSTTQCETEGYDRMTRKDQLPLPAALTLLARERISGEAPPPRRAACSTCGGRAWATRPRGAGRDGQQHRRPGRLRPRRPQAADRARPGRGRGGERRRATEDRRTARREKTGEGNPPAGPVRRGRAKTAKEAEHWRQPETNRPPPRSPGEGEGAAAEGDDKPGGPSSAARTAADEPAATTPSPPIRRGGRGRRAV